MVRFRSPLETTFWDAWVERHGKSLACQHRVGRFHLDFADLATQTAIEVDGASWHADPQDRARDEARDALLQARGWHVIRLRGRDVRENLDACLARVEATLSARRGIS